VRERQALRREVSEAAFRDLLTGLPNRALFRDRVGRALESARRTGDTTAVLSLDLDAFRRLNDSLGHAVGDAVLKETAERLAATIRSADTCARLGGDEFAVLLDGDASVADAEEVAERIRAALHLPMRPGGAMLELTASIGIAVTASGDETREPRALIRDADIAMAAARDQGRDRAVVFEPSMQVALEGSFELETDLRRAVGANELVLEYQPIVDLQTGELVGAEALVRWNHPTRGRLGPNVFIPLAEETGLIGEIGAWVLRTACVEVARWTSRAPNTVPRVSVNLAASQVADPRLPWIVQSALAQAGASPGWLTLEVTESHLVADTVVILERLHALRALGVQISMDDFGTGYSSLAYLQQFPIDHIKIDRSFVIPLDDADQGPGLAAAVVEIGRALGMATIAEGIETDRQLERLRAMGCRLGQGYLLGRPLAPDDILARVGGPAPATTGAAERAIAAA
jgi:diguanylate cyclase (GGDEF)-like protein